jgi:hypothetical protein
MALVTNKPLAPQIGGRTADRSERADRGGTPRGTLSRFRRLALIALTTLAAVVGPQVAVPQPALAIPGLERVYETWGPNDETRGPANQPMKLMRVECPAGKLAIGGGVDIKDGFRDKVHLTRYHAAEDSFYVSAEAELLDDSFDWTLIGFAVCANQDTLEDNGYTYVQRTVQNPSSLGFQAGTSPSCPSGTVAYSAGGDVLPSKLGDVDVAGLVGLQMVRTDAPMSIGRATAREVSPGGYLKPWSLTTSVVCAKRLGGIHLDAEGADSTDPRYASSACGTNSFVHGAMGGSSGPGITDAGPTWLKMIFPISSLKSIIVQMTGPQAGGPVAWATCATGR